MKCRPCIGRRSHDHVPEKLARWVFARGRKFKGLIYRRPIKALWGQGHFPYPRGKKTP